VGEQRRDIIPKTLMDTEGKLAAEERIEVDEVEVYVTGIMESFEGDFTRCIRSAVEKSLEIVVVVVFSPQGCEAMLRSLGFLDQGNELTGKAKQRWKDGHGGGGSGETAYVIVTIGPTTRDHLMDRFGFEADVCANKPSPQGIGEGLDAFFREKRLV
jgi:uroporphyrinogen-III synthase